MSADGVTRVLFVCLGNICRSPTAEAVFTNIVEARGLAGDIDIDSCGTSGWHKGEPPDERATREAARRGYDMTALRGRQIELRDFERFHYILAMDYANLSELQAMCPAAFSGHLGLFLEFAAGVDEEEVPDPYYGGDAGFSHVLDLVEAASEGLLSALQRRD